MLILYIEDNLYKVCYKGVAYFMKLSSFIISLVTGILMFLIVFYMGNNSFSVALFCGILGFIGNMLIGWNAKRKM